MFSEIRPPRMFFFFGLGFVLKSGRTLKSYALPLCLHVAGRVKPQPKWCSGIISWNVKGWNCPVKNDSVFAGLQRARPTASLSGLSFLRQETSALRSFAYSQWASSTVPRRSWRLHDDILEESQLGKGDFTPLSLSPILNSFLPTVHESTFKVSNPARFPAQGSCH